MLNTNINESDGYRQTEGHIYQVAGQTLDVNKQCFDSIQDYLNYLDQHLNVVLLGDELTGIEVRVLNDEEYSKYVYVNGWKKLVTKLLSGQIIENGKFSVEFSNEGDLEHLIFTLDSRPTEKYYVKVTKLINNLNL